MLSARAIDAFAALAHADRLAAFRLLIVAGPEGLASGEIAERLAVPPTRMSFHLATLERAGLVIARRQGRNILYAASVPQIAELVEFLTRDCCGGRPDLCRTQGADMSQECKQ